MAWMIPVAMAAYGATAANQKRAQEKKNQRANATAIEMSPWTGMNPGLMSSQAPGPLGGALQGGVSGAIMAQQFGGGTSPSYKPETPAETVSAANSMGGMQPLEQLAPTLTGPQDTWGAMRKKNPFL
jgi:hypothetical protein